MDSVVNGQSSAASDAVICCKCGADVRKTGFVVTETRYQSYMQRGGKLFKSHDARSGFETSVCLLCREPILVPVEELKKVA